VSHCRTVLRRLVTNHEGATIVEFALVLVPFLIVVLSLVDLGFRIYAGSMLQGALNEAARQVTIGGVNSTTINTMVQGRIATIFPAGTTVVVTPTSYYDYTGIKTMEPITTDVNQNGVLESGDCYTDYNSDNQRDTYVGVSGYGGSDDVVYYNAVATFPEVVPMKLLIGSTVLTESVNATTMIRNQPYASQASPPTVCLP
jgi:Flp pilus assembly protein TadG